MVQESSQSVKTEKKNKKEKKPPKELSPEKKLEQAVKRFFMTPFARRMRYLILIPTQKNDYFILCPDNEKDQNYGSPSMALGYVFVHNKEMYDLIIGWLSKIGVSPKDIALLDLLAYGSVCAKAKWDLSKLVVEYEGAERELTVSVRDDKGDVLASCKPLNRFSTLFPALQLSDQIALYTDKVQSRTGCFLVPYSLEDGENLHRIVVDKTTFPPDIAKVFSENITMIGVRGLDLIDSKEFPKTNPNVKYTGFMFWNPPDSKVLRLLHVMETTDFTVMTTRCNMFLISP